MTEVIDIVMAGIGPPGSTAGGVGGDLSGTLPNPAIGVGKVTAEKLADASVTLAKLADGAVSEAKLSFSVATQAELDVIVASLTAALATKATPADVDAAVAALVNAAPGVLDTLNELAAALGNDPNFAATVVAALANKQPLNASLTAIAALTTTAFGRNVLTLADGAGLVGLIPNGTYVPMAGAATVAAALDFTSAPTVNGAAIPAPVTKRATMPVSGVGQFAVGVGSVTDWSQRMLVALPYTTARWRLRIRNYSTFLEVPGSGTVNCTGVYLGVPSIPSTDRWIGVFTGPATQVLTPGAIGFAADTVSAWVTDPALQLVKGTVHGLSMGFTGDGTTVFHYDSGTYGLYHSAAGSAAAAGNAAWGGVTSRLTTLDCRIEYEVSVPSEVPHILVIGTSIEQGSKGGDGGAETYEAWPNRLALADGALVTNLGNAGSTLASWLSVGNWKLGRADLATTVPDKVIIGGWTNDTGTVLATFQANYRLLVAALRALGIKEVWGGTIIPYPGASDQPGLVAKNNWLRTIPAGLTGIVDFNRAMALTGTPLSITAATNATTTVTTASAAADHLYGALFGTGIPIGAYITAVSVGVSYTISAAATTTTGSVALTVLPYPIWGDPAYFSSYPHPDRAGYARMATIAPSGRR